MIESIPRLAPKRKWYRCPQCGKKLVVYQEGASCKGIFVRCKECKSIIEIRI